MEHLIINIKDWIGDPDILLLDWDCKAMHFHLLCLAAKQQPAWHVPDNQEWFLKVFPNLSEKDLSDRVLPQIKTLWKERVVQINGENVKFLYNQSFALQKEEVLNNKKIKAVRRKKNNNNYGVNLDLVLKNGVIEDAFLKEKNEVEGLVIWDIGVSLLKQQGKSEAQARAFLGKLIKTHGQKNVSNVLAQLSLKQVKPVDIGSYMIWQLRQGDGLLQQQKSRGMVSI